MKKKLTYKNMKNIKKTTTPNWFEDNFSKNLTLGQENQFTSTRGLRYGPLRINKTGIFVNNGTLDSTIIDNTGFHGFGLSGLEQITLDASNGLNVTNGVNSVLQAFISGDNAGDVVMGNYSDGAGTFYDSSAGKFYVKGTLEAVNGTFSGTLTAGISVETGALIVGTNVGLGTAQDSSGVTTIIGNTVTTDYVNALNVTAKYVVAGISISSPNIAGGFIAIGNANNNTFITNVDGVGYIGFYKDGSIRCLLRGTTVGDGGLAVEGGDIVLNNSKSLLIKKRNDSSYGGITVDGNDLWLFTTSSNKFYLKDNGYSDLMNIGSSGMIWTKSNQIQLHNKKLTLSDNDIAFWHDSSGGRDRNVITWGDGASLGIDRTGSWFHINGNDKSAIVPTSQGYNALYCAEAPEVWFFDFCKTKKDIDPMFLEVTEGEMKFIKCDKGYQVWRKRKGHAHKRFESKTALQFYKNEAFLGLAK